MSYMVLECHSSYVILLDENGCFLKAANLSYEVGQTIQKPVLMQEKPSKVLHLKRWITSSVAACFLLLFGIGYYQSYMLPYSSIYLSINPRIQMDLNKKGTILTLSGINEDGKKLLENYNGKGKDKVLVADELIDRAIEMGYLSEGGQVSFSIDTPDESLFTEYGTQLRSGIKEHLNGQISITIEVTHPAEYPPTQKQPQAPPSISIPVYDNTDYNTTDTVTNTTPADTTAPAVPNAPTDTDYSPDSDGVTDYSPDSSNTTDFSDSDTSYEPDDNPSPADTPPDDSKHFPDDDSISLYNSHNQEEENREEPESEQNEEEDQENHDSEEGEVYENENN